MRGRHPLRGTPNPRQSPFLFGRAFIEAGGAEGQMRGFRGRFPFLFGGAFIEASDLSRS